MQRGLRLIVAKCEGTPLAVSPDQAQIHGETASGKMTTIATITRISLWCVNCEIADDIRSRLCLRLCLRLLLRLCRDVFQHANEGADCGAFFVVAVDAAEAKLLVGVEDKHGWVRNVGGGGREAVAYIKAIDDASVGVA